MHQLRIEELDKNIFIPENMDECNREQRLDIAKLVFMYQMFEISYEQFKVLALYNLMNMEYSESVLPSLEEEKWQNITIISDLLDSFFELREDGKLHLVFTAIDNPVKKVSYKSAAFFGPSDWFKDMSWGQFIEGLGQLQSFSSSGKIEHLVNLFAIFYLRQNERFTKINLGKRVAYFDSLDIRYVYYFYLLFNNFWLFLTTSSLIKVDGREIDLRILFQQGNNGSNGTSVDIEHPDLGLRSTTFQMAESGVFGPLDKLMEAKFGPVILNMYDVMVRNLKREAELEAQKNENK